MDPGLDNKVKLSSNIVQCLLLDLNFQILVNMCAHVTKYAVKSGYDSQDGRRFKSNLPVTSIVETEALDNYKIVETSQATKKEARYNRTSLY